MRNFVAKILNAKTMFGSKCSYLKLLVREFKNYDYTSLYHIKRLVHPLIMYDPLEFQIPYHKNAMSLPDNVDNIMTFIERENLRGCPFTKFQQFDLDTRKMSPYYKNYFIGKARNCFKIDHCKINHIPFQPESQSHYIVTPSLLKLIDYLM